MPVSRSTELQAPDASFTAEELREFEQQVRAAASTARSRPRFTPQVLLENKAEAFMTWCVIYFPHRIAEWEDWQTEPVRVMVEEPRGLIMVPAGTMKTTVGATLLPIWWLCQNRDYEIAGCFKDDAEGKKTLRAVKKELIANQALIRDFGPFFGRGCKWNEHEVEVLGRTRISKSPSLLYLPYGAQFLGSRFHKGFVDDVVTRDMAFSQRGNQQFIEWLASDFETGPYPPDSAVDWAPGMTEQILIYGTRWNRNDGYALVEERSERGPLENEHFRPYRVCVIDIIKDEAAQESISKRWPWPKLMAKKAEMQEPMFSWRMRNRATNEVLQVFREPWLRGGEVGGVRYPGCRDSGLSFRTAQLGDRIAIGYDPQSGSTSRWAKYAALVAVGARATSDGSWYTYLFDWWKGQTVAMDLKDPDSQVSRLLDMARAANDFGITPVVVLEDNGVQNGFREPILDAAARKNVQLTVTTMTTGANKSDATIGIENAAVDFQNGWFHMPFALPADMSRTIKFEEEFLAYGTTPFSDVPMAWWFARTWLRENRVVYKPIQYLKPQRLPRYMERRLGRQPRYYRVINTQEPVSEVAS